jgi:hypothetical protein
LGSLEYGIGALALRANEVVYTEGEKNGLNKSNPKNSFRLPCSDLDKADLGRDFQANWKNSQNPYYGTVYQTVHFATLDFYIKGALARQFILSPYAKQTTYATGGGTNENLGVSDYIDMAFDFAETVNAYCGKR